MSETKSSVDLSKFCDPDIVRYSVSTPYWVDGRLIATDGRVLAWLNNAEPQVNPDRKFPDASIIISKVESSTNWVLQQTLLAPPCTECNGTGYAEYHDEDGDYRHRCNNTSPGKCWVEIEGRFIAWSFWKDIQELPGMMIAQDDGGANSMLCFKFDGGHGAVMPLDRKAVEGENR